MNSQLISAGCQVLHRFPLPFQRVLQAIPGDGNGVILREAGNPIAFGRQEFNPHLAAGVPAVRGVRLADVYDEKLDPVAVSSIEIAEADRRPDKRRSSEAAEDQRDWSIATKLASACPYSRSEMNCHA